VGFVDVFLETVSTKCAEADGGSAEDGAGFPEEGAAHCVDLGFYGSLLGGGEER
jgi:hypothetical protein